MSMDQLALVDVPEAQTDGPLCMTCRINPALFDHATQSFARYCGRGGCLSVRKQCHSCGEVYDRRANGSGTKYCSTACKVEGYTRAVARAKKKTKLPQVICLRCQHHFGCREGQVRICPTCRGPYWQAIRVHCLNDEMALRLIEAKQCECCGIPLRMTKYGRHEGVIDHDHACCPGSASCGRCARGVICHRCNTLAGFVEKSLESLDLVLEYLRRGR
jgi:hypothetical protein